MIPVASERNQFRGVTVTPQFRTLSLAAAFAAVLGLVSAAPAMTQAPAAAPPSAADFDRESAIRNVNMSPDGKHIAAIVSPDGVNAYVSIWRSDAMDQAPVNLGCGDRSKCMGVSFVKNDRISVQVRQTITVGTTKTHLFRFFTTDLQGKVWRNALGSTDQTAGPNARVVSTLPRDPKNILTQSFEDGNFYLLDLYSGARKKVATGSDKFGGEQVDLTGEIRARQSFDFENGKVYIAQWIRSPATGSWDEHFRWFAADREPKEIVGFTPDPNIIYVRTNAGRDKTAIFEYDIAARKFLEPIFEIKLFDALDVVQSPAAATYGQLLGFLYGGETGKVYWIDERLGTIAKGLRSALGITTNPVQWIDIATGEKARFSTADGADVDITDWSDDLRYVLAVKSGPRQPPEYYLLTDGTKLTKLGASRPWLNTATLGDTSLVQYPARDGLMIPGFLTRPRAEIYGPGPYPAIILPHGGPWARDNMGWDGSGWVQYFASRGYAVLQPQFRGSDGWGQKLWRAGDGEWGQKMQDDKDDGAAWLVQQGYVDADKIAIHGYSYGGFAAIAASVRPDGPFRCAIAGAGVADLGKLSNLWGDNRIQRIVQGNTVSGMDPMKNTDKIDIPIMLYHGDYDVRVPIFHSRDFYNAVKGKMPSSEFIVFDQMGHQYNRWRPEQTAEVLQNVERFLTTTCGM